MRRAIVLPLLLSLLASSPAAGGGDPVRGMTVSCQTWGWEWGTDAMVDAMRELRSLGVNWIAIHPYARIGADGAVTALRGPGTGEAPRWLARPVAEAHRLGLKIMIKPHLAYWGSPFRWRGDIEFQTDAQWRRFFADYERWITRLAGHCAGADAFVVGTELDRTVHHEAAWRRIIAGVRRQFDGPLTYAANWTDYERVPFWDAVDVIGIQGYFPLAGAPGPPDERALAAAWARVLGAVEEFAPRHDRRVVLSELGYSRSAHAAVRPWDGREGGPDAEETQRRCLEAALRAIEDRDVVVGVFLWKWFAGPAGPENFLMSTPAMRRTIAEHWRD